MIIRVKRAATTNLCKSALPSELGTFGASSSLITACMRIDLKTDTILKVYLFKRKH